MSTRPAIIEKYFTSAFALDKAKLSRILNILEERFKNTQLEFEPKYTVWLASDLETKSCNKFASRLYCLSAWNLLQDLRSKSLATRKLS